MKAKQMKLCSQELHEAYNEILKHVKSANRDNYAFYQARNLSDYILDGLLDTNDAHIINKEVVSSILTKTNMKDIKNEHIKGSFQLTTYPTYFYGYKFFELDKLYTYTIIENNKLTTFTAVGISENHGIEDQYLVASTFSIMIRFLSIYCDKSLKEIFKILNSKIFISDFDRKLFVVTCKFIEILYKYGCGLPRLHSEAAFKLHPANKYELNPKIIFNKLDALFTKYNVDELTKSISLEIINNIKDRRYELEKLNRLYKGGF